MYHRRGEPHEGNPKTAHLTGPYRPRAIWEFGDLLMIQGCFVTAVQMSQTDLVSLDETFFYSVAKASTSVSITARRP